MATPARRAADPHLPYRWTEAEIDLHNVITGSVEACTHDAALADRIADGIVGEALKPTPALLRHLSRCFDTDELGHVGTQLHCGGSYGAGFLLRQIADDMEREG